MKILKGYVFIMYLIKGSEELKIKCKNTYDLIKVISSLFEEKLWLKKKWTALNWEQTYLI